MNIKNFQKILGQYPKVVREDEIYFPVSSIEKAFEDYIKSLKFTIFLTGNINTFTDYLNQIENLFYFIEIENVTLDNNLGISNNASKMSIKSKIYIKN